LTQTWPPNPQFKLAISGETFINDESFTIYNLRPENNVSLIVLSVGDYRSKNFVDVFDVFDTLTLSLRYASDAWTDVFSGLVFSAKPTFTMAGEVLEVGAWGKGYPISNTHCNTSYGSESKNPTLTTAQAILQDLVTNYINKSYDGAATGHAIDNSKVENVHAACSFTHLNSQYLDNFTVTNKVCDIVNSWAANQTPVEPSCHWYVDPSAKFYVKEIDVDHSDGSWDHYWGGVSGTDPGTQASSTIVVKEDMILSDFIKTVEDYRNSLVLFAKLRKPGWDMWTEYRGAGADTGAALWGTDGVNSMLITDQVAPAPKVGSYSVRLEADNAPNLGVAYYPSGLDLNWDITKISSQDSPAYIEFYMRGNHTDVYGYQFRLCSGGIWNNNYVTYTVNAWHAIAADTWVHVKVPLGPYHHEDYKYMTEVGTMDWTDLDGILFTLADAGAPQYWMYIDDLHLTGTVCREARDAAEIAAHDEWQKVIRMDTAVDDTMLSGTPGTTDTGTAARLLHTEMLRRSQTPIVGQIQIPLAPTILPGQTVYINACQQSSGSYRIDKDMRVKDVVHLIGAQAKYGGFETRLNLTDDLKNTHAFGVPSQISLLREYAGALGHAEALNLKGGGIDNLIPKLTETY